ncbi:MAG: glycosyl transferase family 28 [Sphingobacteriaceae bacterium]|nr:MAG: glycosyl transferase family 28 [Sphingobacteriaceae bacterium]
MIFITTGTQAPFNRLIKAMDEIAASLNGEEVIVQAAGVDFEVKNMTVTGFIKPDEFDKLYLRARLIVSHAGMGSIIQALTMNKDIIIVPRYASLGEHRNDHQVATAKKMESMAKMPVAYDIADLKTKIDEVSSNEDKVTHIKVGPWASEQLMAQCPRQVEVGR